MICSWVWLRHGNPLFVQHPPPPYRHYMTPCRAGNELVLAREPTNPVDSSAVRMLSSDGALVGSASACYHHDDSVALICTIVFVLKCGAFPHDVPR